MHEFALIKRYFAPLARKKSAFIELGLGDDCALFSPAPNHVCAVSTDTLVSGVHFLPDLAPARLAHRALVVNLSDLAAMGARARGFTLALTLPEVSESWLAPFSQGLAQCADDYDVVLMGGDTTRGPLSLTLTVFGELPQGSGLRRGGAQVGDDVWVSGVLGAAWCGLMLATKTPDWLNFTDLEQKQALDAFDLPSPRLALGEALRALGASAALDLSDGLAGDATHIAEASDCSFEIDLDELPVFAPLSASTPDVQTAWRIALTGGDDYELLFTAPAACRRAIVAESARLSVPVSRMGRVVPKGEKAISFSSKDRLALSEFEKEALGGFKHFA